MYFVNRILIKHIFIILFFSFTGVIAQIDSTVHLTFDFNEHQIKEKNNLLTPKAVGVTFAEDRFGNENSAVNIHGNNSSYLNLGTSALLKPQNLTISIWVKMFGKNEFGKGYLGNPIIVTKSINYEDFNMSYALLYDFKNDNLTSTNSFDSLNSRQIYSNKIKDINKWHHLVMSFSKTDFCFYMDGKLVNKLSKNFATKYLESDSVLVGHSGCKKNQRYLIGSVDDIQFFHRVLSEKEVLDLYHAPNPNWFKNIVDECFKYGIIIIIFIIIIIIIIYRNKQKLKKEKFELNNKISELELKVVKAQINPHFISNSLAAIQELMYTNQIEKGVQYLAKFSFFLRQVLNYSDENYIYLAEELEVIKLYIELEKLRFDDNFNFELIIDESIETEQLVIPSLIIQPFVENAIWHGLLPIKQKNNLKLLIHIYVKDGFPIIEIEDNGIGRDLNKDNQEKSKGTKLMFEKFDSLNRLNNTMNYKIDIIDLFTNDKRQIGTRIKIQIDNIK